MINTKEPNNFKDVVTQSQWVNAMNDELNALELNHTWEITDIPKRKRAIGCKCLYKTKSRW